MTTKPNPPIQPDPNNPSPLPVPDPPQPAVESTVETGWLLDDGLLCVGTCDAGFGMVAYTDSAALRFAREWDAENFRHGLIRLHLRSITYDRVRPRDHQWG